MPTKSQPIDTPNRRTVEELFNQLRRDAWGFESKEYVAYKEADAEVDRIEAELRKDRRYVAAVAKRDRLREADRRVTAERRLAVDRVRREYLAKGLTKEVQRKVAALVEKYG